MKFINYIFCFTRARSGAEAPEPTKACPGCCLMKFYSLQLQTRFLGPFPLSIKAKPYSQQLIGKERIHEKRNR